MKKPLQICFPGLWRPLRLSGILLGAVRHGKAWYLASEMYNKP